MKTVEKHQHSFCESDWPFDFPANVGAVTTEFVMNDKKPIVEVLYWEDGDWQFMCDTPDDKIQGMAVCMGCLFTKFPWISKFKSLKPGELAYLEKGVWKVESIE